MNIKEINARRRLLIENPKFKSLEIRIRELMREVELQDRTQLVTDLTMRIIDAYAEQMILSGIQK